MTTAAYTFAFANQTHLLTDSTRLSTLKSRVDSIATDLATLDGMTEAEREGAVDLREQVLAAFQTLAET